MSQRSVSLETNKPLVDKEVPEENQDDIILEDENTEFDIIGKVLNYSLLTAIKFFKYV